MASTLLLIFLSLLVCSCGTSIPYKPDSPMQTTRFTARDGAFSASVPQGWIVSDDSIAPELSAWLLREDLAAGIAIRELHPDKMTQERISHEGMKLLASISAGFHENAAVTVEPKEFDMRGRKYCSYELDKGANRQRLVVFQSGNRYFECEAAAVKGEWRPSEIDKLFSVQQSVLSSIGEVVP